MLAGSEVSRAFFICASFYLFTLVFRRSDSFLFLGTGSVGDFSLEGYLFWKSNFLHFALDLRAEILRRVGLRLIWCSGVQLRDCRGIFVFRGDRKLLGWDGYAGNNEEKENTFGTISVSVGEDSCFK